MTEELVSRLRAQGYQARVVPVQRLHDLRREIEQFYSQGFFDQEFYRERLAIFAALGTPQDLPDARSLIVVAVPEPQRRITFALSGGEDGEVSFVVPPTFFPMTALNRQVERLVAEILAPGGHWVSRIVLPKKLLAVHSGLGVYGRNNLCYVPGLGSFHRLVALCSDLMCPDDDWLGLRQLERCENCRACLHRCPTGAITADRFLVRAERCLTFHNERCNDIDFPDWIDPAWHNSLIGCSHCQNACPENREFLDRVEAGATFTSAETRLLLTGASFDQLLPEMADKFERFDMLDLLEVLPRNLRAVLNVTPSSRHVPAHQAG